jgi:hypothetical protein
MISIKNGLHLLVAVSLVSTVNARYVSSPAAAMTLQAAAAQPSKASPAGNSSLTIRLEQKKGEKTIPMRPEHVFEPGDVVRFRLTSGFDGYLYVVDLGSSGTYTPLFPADGTTNENLIHKGTDSLVPSIGDGWFEIEGPAGFDVVYFLVSSSPLDITAGKGAKGNAAPSNPAAPPPDYLKPRCNDAIFQARGECIDDSAGPAPLARDVPLPPQISRAAPNISRDIVFESGEDDDEVKATAPSTTPVVYIFRLAHH